MWVHACIVMGCLKHLAILFLEDLVYCTDIITEKISNQYLQNVTFFSSIYSTRNASQRKTCFYSNV